MSVVLSYHDAIVYDTDVALLSGSGWLNDHLILFWLMFISLKELRATYEWNWIVTYGAAFVALAIGASLLVVALRAGDRAYEDELEEV